MLEGLTQICTRYSASQRAKVLLRASEYQGLVFGQAKQRQAASLSLPSLAVGYVIGLRT